MQNTSMKDNRKNQFFYKKEHLFFGSSKKALTFAPAFRNEGCSLRQGSDNKCDSGFFRKTPTIFQKKFAGIKKAVSLRLQNLTAVG